MENITITIPDNELILLAKAGNEQAFETLVRRHLSVVYGSCLRYLVDQDEAEDAVQETFVKVWRNLKKIDPQKNFKAWVLEIAKNTCLDILKKKQAVPMSAFENEDGYNYLAESLVSSDRSPAETADQSILSRILNSALEKLSPAYQKVLAMYYKEGLNFREISETLNEPLHTVKSRHRRAVIGLRSILMDNEPWTMDHSYGNNPM
jgi:RNA polymerase sigma-70 factor (ECF subfamily)